MTIPSLAALGNRDAVRKPSPSHLPHTKLNGYLLDPLHAWVSALSTLADTTKAQFFEVSDGPETNATTGSPRPQPEDKRKLASFETKNYYINYIQKKLRWYPQQRVHI